MGMEKEVTVNIYGTESSRWGNYFWKESVNKSEEKARIERVNQQVREN